MSTRSRKADKLQSTIILSERLAERRSHRRSADAVAAELLEPGTLVGRYLTLSRIGVGGMGVVYRAHDTELNRTVALKVLPPKFTRHPEYLKRFHIEAQAQARLNSANVITLYELMEHEAGQILVLEYVEGETLESRVRHHGPLSAAEAARVFEQALRGVEQIHRLGVVHRDLKPANIFLTRDGGVKVMDFGIARLVDDHDPSYKRSMVGTLLYIPPEQINGRETDCRSDIYTLGISLFEAVTGRLPFERRTDYALMHAHVAENPPSPKEFRRRLPRELEAVILKAIAKDPNRRYQTATEFRMALLNLGLVERRQRNPAVESDGVQNPGARRIWGGTWLDAALVAGVLLLALILDVFPRQSTPTAASRAGTAQVRTPETVKASEPKVAPERPTQKPRSVVQRKPKYEPLRDAWGG